MIVRRLSIPKIFQTAMFRPFIFPRSSLKKLSRPKHSSLKDLRYIYVALFLLLIQTGCNFRLRGIYESPFWLAPVAIDAQAVHRDLKPLLTQNLRVLHIDVTPILQAHHIITLEKDTLVQKITYVSASTTPRQYNLIYSLQFSLIAKKTGVPLITSETVSVTRQLTVNNNRILGSDFETKLIYEEMHADAIRQLLNQISRIHDANRIH